MRLSIIVAAASVLLAGCSSCCNTPCKRPCSPCKSPCAPAPAPARAPCAIRNSIVPPSWYYGSSAPKLTQPPAIAVTPARGSFRLPEMGTPTYSTAPARIERPTALAVQPVAPTPTPAVVVIAPVAPAPVVKTSASGPAAIISPLPAAGSKTGECEDCSDGHCGVPPPR